MAPPPFSTDLPSRRPRGFIGSIRSRVDAMNYIVDTGHGPEMGVTFDGKTFEPGDSVYVEYDPSASILIIEDISVPERLGDPNPIWTIGENSENQIGLMQAFPKPHQPVNVGSTTNQSGIAYRPNWPHFRRQIMLSKDKVRWYRMGTGTLEPRWSASNDGGVTWTHFEFNTSSAWVGSDVYYPRWNARHWQDAITAFPANNVVYFSGYDDVSGTSSRGPRLWIFDVDTGTMLNPIFGVWPPLMVGTGGTISSATMTIVVALSGRIWGFGRGITGGSGFTQGYSDNGGLTFTNVSGTLLEAVDDWAQAWPDYALEGTDLNAVTAVYYDYSASAWTIKRVAGTGTVTESSTFYSVAGSHPRAEPQHTASTVSPTTGHIKFVTMDSTDANTTTARTIKAFDIYAGAAEAKTDVASGLGVCRPAISLRSDGRVFCFYAKPSFLVPTELLTDPFSTNSASRGFHHNNGPYYLSSTEWFFLSSDQSLDVTVWRTTTGDWSSKTAYVLGSHTISRGLAAWFEPDTPGLSDPKIHVIYQDTVPDEYFHAIFDCSTLSWSTPVSIATGLSNTVECSRVTVARNGDIHIALRNSGTWLSLISIDGGSSFSSYTTFIEANNLDLFMLFPASTGDDADIGAFYFDDSADRWTIYMYDASAGTWSESASLRNEAVNDMVGSFRIRQSDGAIALAWVSQTSGSTVPRSLYRYWVYPTATPTWDDLGLIDDSSPLGTTGGFGPYETSAVDIAINPIDEDEIWVSYSLVQPDNGSGGIGWVYRVHSTDGMVTFSERERISHNRAQYQRSYIGRGVSGVDLPTSPVMYHATIFDQMWVADPSTLEVSYDNLTVVYRFSDDDMESWSQEIPHAEDPTIATTGTFAGAQNTQDIMTINVDPLPFVSEWSTTPAPGIPPGAPGGGDIPLPPPDNPPPPPGGSTQPIALSLYGFAAATDINTNFGTQHITGGDASNRANLVAAARDGATVILDSGISITLTQQVVVGNYAKIYVPQGGSASISGGSLSGAAIYINGTHDHLFCGLSMTSSQGNYNDSNNLASIVEITGAATRIQFAGNTFNGVAMPGSFTDSPEGINIWNNSGNAAGGPGDITFYRCQWPETSANYHSKAVISGGTTTATRSHLTFYECVFAAWQRNPFVQNGAWADVVNCVYKRIDRIDAIEVATGGQVRARGSVFRNDIDGSHPYETRNLGGGFVAAGPEANLYQNGANFTEFSPGQVFSAPYTLTVQAASAVNTSVEANSGVGSVVIQQ